MTITVTQSPRLNQFYLNGGVAGGSYGIAEGTILIDPVTGLAYNSAQQYVWDTNTLAWVKETQSVGGGVGGAATIADGADVTEGATTDAAVVTDANGTVSGKLRGLVQIFASVWDSGNGRLKVDGSAVTQPVSIATMPSTPVTGTFWQNTQPISGSISFTAPQHAIVDSGSITISNATLAVTQSGNFTVQPITFASPQHVIVDSGTATVNTKTALTASAPAAVSVGVASAQVVAANANRTGLVAINTSANIISFGEGNAAVLNSGITLAPYGVWEMDEYTYTTAAINAIASAAASNLSIQEFA